MALVSACTAKDANPDAEIVLFTPVLNEPLRGPQWLQHRIVHNDCGRHYVSKPRAWLDLLQTAKGPVALLDADAIVLGSLSEVFDDLGFFAAVVAEDSYMKVRSGLAPLSHNCEQCQGDLLSRLMICPEKGAALRKFFRLPSDQAMATVPYFSVAFLFLRPPFVRARKMFDLTAEFGQAHPNARELAIWPENTPMNCAAAQLGMRFEQLDPARYSMRCPSKDKRIWHLDGSKLQPRSLERELGSCSDRVQASLCRHCMLQHPLVKAVW
jgi:hypothetical protein